MQNEIDTMQGADEVRCAECNTLLEEGEDREVTESGVFCRSCFEKLVEQVEQAIGAQSAGINYPMALVGALAGGAAGALVWWGFTVVTNIAFGLVAIVIGVAVGKGATLFAGNKRSSGLQFLSVVVAALSFFYASYLVNRSFVHQAYEEQGQAVVLPLLPSLDLMYDVVALDFGLFEVIFLAIVVYQAWRIPAPFRLRR